MQRGRNALPPDVAKHITAVLNSSGWATMAPIAKGLCRGCPGAATGPDDDWICAQCPLAGIAIAVALADRQR